MKDSHFVPAISTNVEFTSKREDLSLSLSSSGGGLFGRPTTRKGCGALLNLLGSISPQVGPSKRDV